MNKEEFDIDNVVTSHRYILKLLAGIIDVDVINDGLTELMITSKFKNIFWYISINKTLLHKQDFSLLNTYHYSDSYRSMRLIDFMKDNDGNIPVKHKDYLKELMNDLILLNDTIYYTKHYDMFAYDIYSSKVFKQYIINIVYILTDIYNATKISK